MNLNQTPKANRLHIAILGKTNSGKSTILNAFTKQDVSIVSEVKGTTTDLVYKAMEVHGLGPIMFIDTPGFEDDSVLGAKRLEKMELALKQCDIAIMIFHSQNIEKELKYLKQLKAQQVPVLCIYHQFNGVNALEMIKQQIKEEFLVLDAMKEDIVEKVRTRLISLLPQDYGDEHIVHHLVSEDDHVLLVMPQDIQAPKGRLILPQVQTIRDLLDGKCIVTCVTTDKLEKALAYMHQAPKLIICDSQVFDIVYKLKPKESMLTSFSVLFAKYKGDIDYFVESVKVIQNLNSESKVLIAEACTHAPMEEDIGRVKIPAMLKKLKGVHKVDIVAGMNFPQDLSEYDLIIHCGACMFHRKYVLNRVEQAKEQQIPMCNYGITIAYLKKILDYVVY